MSSKSPEVELLSSNKDTSPLCEQEGQKYHSILKNEKKKITFAVGELRNPCKFSRVEWLFLLVSSISLGVVGGLSVERFVTFHRTFQNLSLLVNDTDEDLLICGEWHCTPDFILTVCVVLNLVFCLLYSLDALFREREFELLALIGACWVIAIYVVGNVVYNNIELQRNPGPVKIVKLVCVVAFVPPMTILAIVVYRKMGYLIFNFIGANLKLTRAYQVRSFFETLQFFHMEIMANIVALAYSGGGGFSCLPEKVIMIILLVLLIIVTLLGYISITWEKKMGCVVWYIFMLPFLTFYIYKIAQVSLKWSYYSTEYEERTTSNDYEINFISVGAAILIANILGILAVVVLSIAMAIIIRNFGLGLKYHAIPPFSKCAKRDKKTET